MQLTQYRSTHDYGEDFRDVHFLDYLCCPKKDQMRTNLEKKDLEVTRKVLNEDGQLLDVIFDPVLKCYYEPT